MNAVQPTPQGIQRFDMGCLENHKCGSASSGVIAVGKRQTADCHECCTSDHCNSDLCSHLKPTAESRWCETKLRGSFKLTKYLDGNWTHWSSWTSCDVTCGNGTRVRTRTCTNPAPEHGGADCIGKRTENMQCTKDLCPVHGGWSRWENWGSCSVTCDFGIQRRDRSCSNPYPSRFGEHCYGDSRDDRLCLQPPCANGGWTTWGTWSTCTLTCGGGIQSRERTCNNPKPSYLGLDCIGNPIKIQSCNTNRCPPVVSAFSVDQPYDYTTKLTFSHTIYQHGGDFDPSTGTFTCSIPGTYHFSVTLVKQRSGTRVDAVQCNLYKNISDIILIKVDPTDDDTDKGSAAISQSVVLHLNKEDTVYLSNCSNPPSTYLEWWSSFTGFLLYPDS